MKQLSIILLAALAFAACTNDDRYTLDDFTKGGGTATDTTVDPLPDTLCVDIVYNGSNATVTVASGFTADTSPYLTVSRQNADITITSTTDKYLLITLSGQSADGSLLVYSQAKYGITLNGLTLTNADGPAINNQCSKALYLTLADGTQNTLADGSEYTTAIGGLTGDKEIDQKGTFFSEGQVYVTGQGTLTVNAAAKNGFASDDYIVISDGTLNINVAKTGSNGIKANDGFTISGGTLAIDVKADGARGIRCEARTTISGGNTQITTSGDPKITTTTVDGFTADTTTCAGIKSDSLFTMTAGSLVIKSTGDGGKGISCAENVEFSGGTLNITTTGSNDVGKPKGVKSDTGIIVSGGSFTVKVNKSWACDNGTETDDPKNRLTIVGTPATKTLQQKSVTIIY